ncbi:uncharacterized protein EMH_0033190 [Eimeria mitis]|uniref:Uncharacterized protein n=1 Tax=Eimeria mitis TaxID=44415 RepID=U6JU51_9EIME|nr:uncharacterized protein EMH_0033190 [Eimeria mitis]CDJ27597.1 hypothetical protein, conserved [Eimeria mitis]
MFFTYVVRPGEAPEGRGPQFEPFWSFIVNYSLRLGVFMLLGGYICLLMTVSAGNNDPLSLLNVLRAVPETAGKCPLWAAQLGCGLLILGYLTVLAFQSTTDDDSRSIFFLETYHSEGAGEAWGWLGAVCFKLTAFSEFAALATWGSSSFPVLDAVYTVMLGVSLGVMFMWAMFFEPVSHRFDVRLTQSAMRNEYYKSRNAMAYYGPAVVNADGEIDIAAAAQQAQACLNCCA